MDAGAVMTSTQVPGPVPVQLSRQEREHLVLVATCAPSVHNTQPWSFEESPRGLLVRADASRQLAVLDPDGRELRVSCGAAVQHLEVAARALGLDTQVRLLPDPADPTVLAELVFTRGQPPTDADVAAAVRTLTRHTHRGRFTGEPVSPALLTRLAAVVEAQGAVLRVVHPDELVEVEVLLSRAEQALQRLPGYVDELARWVRRAGDDPGTDGLPAAAVDHGTGRAESLQGRQFAASPPVRPTTPPVAEHPVVVLLSTAGDTPAEQVQAGRALSALLLAAAADDVLAQPLGQAVDTAWARTALNRLLGTLGAPQMLLRLGHGHSDPLTPRRPVGDVLA